jgi:hypothetical protein
MTHRKLSEIDRAVTNLESQWAAEKAGLSGFVKKWGAILGLLAAIVTLPKSMVDGYNSLVTSANTTITKGVPITIAYDAARSTLRLTYSFALVNDGTADDVIEDAWATLTPPKTDKATAISFPRSTFTMTERGQPISVPFVIAKSSSHDVRCSIEAQADAATIPELGGDWTFKTELKHRRKGKPLIAGYVLFAPSTYIQDLKKPGSSPLSYENPKEAL